MGRAFPRPGARRQVHAVRARAVLRTALSYCSFNRYPYREGLARRYFRTLREELRLVADQGYDFTSLYVGGGTPTQPIERALRHHRPGARALLH